MILKVTHFTLFVEDQEKALQFYRDTLGFKLHTDAQFENMRWLTVHAPAQPDLEVVLFLAEKPAMKELVGKQAPECAFFSLETDNCRADYEALKSKGVEFVHPPKDEPWGIATLFKDLYGNLVYLVQSRK
jgi:uncharacterized glyoxalase superfamily protein PhnB